MANKSESIKVDGKKYVGGVDYATGKDVTVSVGIDVSDALKGLKAVQREAKKTARLMKEIENRRDVNDLSDDEILDELRSRGWDMDEANLHQGCSEEPLYRQIQLYKNNENQEE